MNSSRIAQLFFLIAISFSLTSCNNDKSITNSENLEIEYLDIKTEEILDIKTQNSEIVLKNNSELDIFYVLIESETANLVDINPNYKEWSKLEALSQITVSYDEIPGYDSSSSEAWITWRTKKEDSRDSQTIVL